VRVTPGNLDHRAAGSDYYKDEFSADPRLFYDLATLLRCDKPFFNDFKVLTVI
jgi:hypothetical protein